MMVIMMRWYILHRHRFFWLFYGFFVTDLDESSIVLIESWITFIWSQSSVSVNIKFYSFRNSLKFLNAVNWFEIASLRQTLSVCWWMNFDFFRLLPTFINDAFFRFYRDSSGFFAARKGWCESNLSVVVKLHSWQDVFYGDSWKFFCPSYLSPRIRNTNTDSFTAAKHVVLIGDSCQKNENVGVFMLK